MSTTQSVATTSRSIKHPRAYVALRTRTRLLGTLNVAVSLWGRSSGWGGSGRPRLTFVGFNRGPRPPFHRALELVLVRGGVADDSRILPPKCKAPSAVVLYEVDADGNRIDDEAVA